MDQTQPSSPARSNIARQQSAGIRKALIILFSLTCCQTNKSKAPIPAAIEIKKSIVVALAPQETMLTKAEVLTRIGQSAEAVWSNGEHILFISYARPDHTHSQVYELDLKTRTETRMTYSDGRVYRPFSVPNGIVYASTTDAEKEQFDITRLSKPVSRSTTLELEETLIRGRDDPFLEIYFRRGPHDTPQRLTHLMGFDAVDSVLPSQSQFLVSSQRDKKTELVVMDTTGRAKKTITALPATFRTFATPSPDGKLLTWVNVSADGKKQIVVSEYGNITPRIVADRGGDIMGLTFLPDGQSLVVAANWTDLKNFDLFWVRLDGTCVRQITFDPQDDIYPSLNSDNRLLWTSHRNGSYQIYMAQLQISQDKTCLPNSASIK